MHVERDVDSTGEGLRRRIRNVFTEVEPSLSNAVMRPIEDRVLMLMRDYVLSPVAVREKVYRKQEAELLKAVHALRRIYPDQRSSSLGGEHENELQQLNHSFYFKNRKLVWEFLQQHRFLISVLFEIRKQIDQFFGSDVLSNLEVVTDPEDNHGSPKLFALILTNLPSVDASTRLNQLDQWWLNQPSEVRRVLSIDVDYLDGSV